MPAIAQAPRAARMASPGQLSRIRTLAPLKLAFPEQTLARLDLYTSLEAKLLLDHLTSLPDRLPPAES